MRPGLASVALSVAALTLTSRILGFGRSVVFSKTVGDTCLGDAYNAANTVPNVLFEVVAGGVLAGVVIPVVARHVGCDRPAAAGRTVSALLTWTLLVLTPAALAAAAAARVYGEAFAGVGCAGSAETLAALLVMFVPQIWLYGLAVVSAGVLQAHHKFVLAAAAPLFSSVVVVVAYLVFATVATAPAAGSTVTTGAALAVLGWGTTAGVAVLALTTALPLARLGLRLRPRLRFAPGDSAVVLRIAAAGAVGLALQQAAVLLITWVARNSGDVGGLTRFGYANALYLLPYAVLAAPLLQMIFPRLTTAAEAGGEQVVRVLADLAPVVVILGWLGTALLAATAVPVARVFVLGPGSGRTDALSWPIVAFSLAVVGNTLLGLSSRTLLAQHRARAAGLVTVSAWTTVIACILALRLLVEPTWVVTALAASVSTGLLVGAVVGWAVVRRSLPGIAAVGMAGTTRSGLLAAVPAGGLGAVLARWFDEVGLVGALGGALLVGLLCTLLFLGVLRLVDAELCARLWTQLRTRRPSPVGESG